MKRELMNLKTDLKKKYRNMKEIFRDRINISNLCEFGVRKGEWGDWQSISKEGMPENFPKLKDVNHSLKKNTVNIEKEK